MKRTILSIFLVGLGLSASVMGCSRAAAVCEVICECEHCNDQAKIEACNQLGTAEDVAAAYACSDQWDAYTTCVEERGTCDATESRFSTRNDMGEDRCQDEVDDLDDCIDKASAHDGTSGNFN
jgi:hypothetical protein